MSALATPGAGLALPHFDAAIPAELVSLDGLRQGAGFARFLLDASVIQGRVRASAAANPAAVCQQHLQRWLQQRLGPLQCLDLGFTVYLGRAPGLDDDPRSGGASLLWGADPDIWVVGPALEALEALHPRLGSTVLNTIESQCWRSVPVFTPSEALCTAQMLYWYGESDETWVVEEACGRSKRRQQAMREEMVTRAKIEAEFPAWALAYHSERKVLSPRALRRLVTGAADPRVRRIAELTLALSALKLDRRFQPEVEGEFVGYGAVLAWREEQHPDLLLRIFDDHINLAHEAECYDWCGEQHFDLEDADAFGEWALGMVPHLEAIRLIDALIHALSTPDWPHTLEAASRDKSDATSIKAVRPPTH